MELPEGPFLTGPFFLWLLRGMCSQDGVKEKLKLTLGFAASVPSKRMRETQTLCTKIP